MRRFKITTGLPGPPDGYRKVLPFRRAWAVIALVALMDAAFLVPAVLAFGQAAQSWARMESLFDLVAAVFLTAWLLGWSMAPLLLTALLVMMLFGREVIRARPGTLEVFIGLPVLGLAVSYPVAEMRKLRLEEPAKKSGKAWRGSHFAFDHEGRTIAFASRLDSDEAARIRKEIESASRSVVPDGEPLNKPGDTATAQRKATADRAGGRDVRDPPLSAPVSAPAPRTVSPATAGGMAGGMASHGAHRLSLSTLALIAANLAPVAGTLFLGWNLGDIMVLYWAESAAIGFFNLLKIVVIGRWATLLAGPFFLGHFGGFMAVHFLFIYTLFVEGGTGIDSGGGKLSDVAALFASLWPAVAALFLSHGLSFVLNFLGRREYRGRRVKDQMAEAYTRIIFMHLVLIFGGGLTLFLGSPTPVLLGVIALKIVFDIRAHRREHRHAAPPDRP